jgi:hypothetical protein
MITPEQRQQIIDLFPTHTRTEIAQKLGLAESTIRGQGRLLGLKKPDGFMSQFNKRNEGNKATRLTGGKVSNPAGTVAWLANYGGGNTHDAEWYIYQGKGHPIILKRYIWEQHRGKIPRGYVVRYKDDNPARCVLENLECISRKENAARNINREKMGATIREGRAKDSYYASRLFMKDRQAAQLVITHAPELIDAYKAHRQLTNKLLQNES